MLFLPSLKQSGHLDKIHMTICIVGSRKIENLDDYGNQGWNIFAPNLTIYGFDADEKACALANEDLANRKVTWQEKHIPKALGNQIGKTVIYITKYPGCSSLYPPSKEYIKRFASNSELIELVDVQEIEITTLDAFCQNEKINEIDFLQIDVQGAEIHVLEGARQIVENGVLGILTEIEFSEIYTGQPLFSDVDISLRSQGFTLFDFGKLNRNIRRDTPIFSQSHPGTLSWTDAFYFRDLIQANINTPLKTPEKIFKLACLADILSFPDYALELLKYLTINYGNNPSYNFANNIIECLAQVPDLVHQGLDSLPIVTQLKEYISDEKSNEIFSRSHNQEEIAHPTIQWPDKFLFKGNSLYYNRIGINNVGERAVEIPIAFIFLATVTKKDKILEVGNVLSLYENSLSEHLGLRARRIVDKFERATGVDNVDLMDLPSDEKYTTIVSVSTVEHVGQGVEPSSKTYGEQIDIRDREAPLKAICKIYELLETEGKALITFPFGKLIDGGWYIQFNREYLDLLIIKYGIPPQAISKSFLREVAMEITPVNPREMWVEEEEDKLSDIEYNWPWPCANAIAVLELTKLPEAFTLNLDTSAQPLQYSSPIYAQAMFTMELGEDKFQMVLGKLREINLIFSPDWSKPEEDLFSDLSNIFRNVLIHPDKNNMTLLIEQKYISEVDANLILSSVTMNLLMEEDLDVMSGAEICLITEMNDIQWAALLPRVLARITLENGKNQEVMIGMVGSIPALPIDRFINGRAVQLRTGAWDLK
jgi:FkbM family methyltransferase